MSRFFRVMAWLLVVGVLLAFWRSTAKHTGASEERDFTTFVKMVETDQVRQGVIRKEVFNGELKNGTRIMVRLPSDPILYYPALIEHGVPVKSQTGISDVWMTTLFSFFLFGILIVVFWLFIMRQAQAGGNQAMAFGRSRARRFGEGMPKVTFDDVAGVEEAKQELAEVVEFLKNPKKFQALGARIPKGVLLLGPPGSGKTLLARAVAGEAEVPFFHISGSDFVEMFVGVGASRVRDLFEQAKANRPSIIFIDEIDAVGRQRFAGVGGGHDEREQTLNQLLAEMDGFDPNVGVILVAATNRPDVLDPALLRPGRFDRRIVVDSPDLQGRKAILKVHTKGKPLAPEVDLVLLARRTPGFSGADLANLVNEAALLAARRNKTQTDMADFDESIDRVMAGPQRKSRIISEKEKAIVANHEVGHAVLSELLPDADPVHKVSILPRGMALGYTMRAPLDDKYLVTKNELLDNITVFLGGRVAEEMVFGQTTTGDHDDLERATEIARMMVTEFGMSDKLGPVTLGRKHHQPFLGRDMLEDRNYSEEIASTIDQEMRAIIDQCLARAKKLLEENQESMARVVEVLQKKETLDRQEVREILIQGNGSKIRPE